MVVLFLIISYPFCRGKARGLSLSATPRRFDNPPLRCYNGKDVTDVQIWRLKRMKKFAAVLLALCLTLSCTAALAAGKLEVAQENYIPTEFYSGFVGYLFAEVTNTGDKNVEFNDGVIEVLNEDGDVTETDSIYAAYPSILAPGETGYVMNNVWANDADSLSDIADHTLTVTGKTSKEETYPRLDTSAVVESYDRSGTTYYRVVLTITNNTSETVYDAMMVAGVYDADGKLLYVGTDGLYNVGIPAGAAVETRIDVDSTVGDYWTKNEVTPVSVNSICWYEND